MCIRDRDKDVVKGIMELAAEHGISINDESRGYEPALISFCLLYTSRCV